MLALSGDVLDQAGYEDTKNQIRIRVLAIANTLAILKRDGVDVERMLNELEAELWPEIHESKGAA